MKIIDKYKKIVIKIGSSSIIDPATKKIRSSWITSFCKDISKLNKNKKIIIVCSGAIALGSNSISKNKNLRRLEDKQAAAAVGQIELAYNWKQKLKKHKINVAQLLLTLEDSEIRRRYLNARKTINSLHQNNIIPIINENDTVATEEIRYGDNDRLAARVAQMADADLLILLSDVDGLYDDNPFKNNNAKKIKVVTKIDKKIEQIANNQTSNLGSGGMETKILAAKICMNNGCTTIITNSSKKNPIIGTSSNNSTIFKSKITPSSSRKQWLLNHLHPTGTIKIDEGAYKAIINNKSLLPAGIIHVGGNFDRGDIITILTSKNIKIAIGISAYDVSDAKKIIGKNSKEIKNILGYEGRDEIVHKDDLVKVAL